jgi:hypothetical protein
LFLSSVFHMIAGIYAYASFTKKSKNTTLLV